MLTKKSNSPIIISVLIVVVSILFTPPLSAQEINRASKKRVDAVGVKGTEVGTGWSTKENPEEAVKEAIQMALDRKKNNIPDFAIIFATSGSDMKAILLQAKKMFKNKTKIYGGTSDSRAVMTNRGYAKATERAYEYAKMEGKRSLAVMTVTSKEITFGVGSASFSGNSIAREAVKLAVLKAIKNAGKSIKELPKAILITPTRAVEEDVIEGIESIVGKKIPIIGGTAGMPTWAVFGENDVYEKGVSLVVIYTKLKVGYTSEFGFDVREPTSGIVTKAEGQAIVEIDNRPALDVYDGWLGGEIGRLRREETREDVIKGLLVLHPLYRRYTAPDGNIYLLFSHPWPKDKEPQDRALMTSSKFKAGERIYLSRGTWEVLINRVGNLPINAKINGKISPDVKPILGIGYICAGVVGVIPETERAKIPLLINYTNYDAPFIATLTAAEQVHFPGIGSKLGNLATSFLVISDK